MGRGLDGYFDYLSGDCAVLKGPREGSHEFPVAMARGKHLFPFRTEQLSLSAPMVLGPQGPGRVGRRRFNVRKAAPQGGLSTLWGHPGSRRERPSASPYGPGRVRRGPTLSTVSPAARPRVQGDLERVPVGGGLSRPPRSGARRPRDADDEERPTTAHRSRAHRNGRAGSRSSPS